MTITPTLSPVQPQEADLLVKYLIFPIIVVIIGAIAGFFATYLQRKRFSENESKSKTNNLLDNLIIDLTSLSEIFEKLKTNIEEREMYYIKNVNIGNESIKHIRLYIDDIYLLNSEDLRRRLIGCIDSAATLFSDILSLESYAIDRNNEYKKTHKESTKELRSLSVKFLKQDLTVSENGFVNSTKINDEGLSEKEKIKLLSKISSANSIIREVYDERTARDRDFSVQISLDEKRRLSFNFKLLDIQTKIREILFQLNNQRNS